MSAYSQLGLSIEAIPAFTDNYIWLLRGEGTGCAVIDPGEAEPVLQRLRPEQLDLRYILLTHHHFDHIGGVQELLEHYPDALIFGPDDHRIEHRRTICREGDVIKLKDPDLTLAVLEVPAHTRSHIAFHGEGLLFPGDTLFSVGCGRLFEGTPEQMQAAMDKFAGLPSATRVFCAHEYTLSNCDFAIRVEPENQALQQRRASVRSLRDAGNITLPSVLRDELAVNPFMRTREKTVVDAARRIDPGANPGAGVLSVIRKWKDSG